MQIGSEGTTIVARPVIGDSATMAGLKTLQGEKFLSDQMQRRPPDDAERTDRTNATNLLVRFYAQVCLAERLRFSTMGNCHGYVDAVQNLLAHAA